MAFNPSFSDIETAYSNNKRAKNSETGKFYKNYQLAEISSGELATQIDGKFGGSKFVSSDGTVQAVSHPGVRGFDIDSTLLKTSDGKVVLFY